MELKSNEVKQLFDHFVRQAEPEFLAYFEEKAQKLDELIRQYEKYFKKVAGTLPDWENAEDHVKACKKFGEEVIGLLQKEQEGLTDDDFTSLFGEFISSVGEIVDQSQKTIVFKEIFDAYGYGRTDSPLLWVRKALANTGFFFKQLAKKILNVFRRLFKKQMINLVQYRKRRAPFREMARYFLLGEFPDKALEQIVQVNKLKSQSLQKLWKFDEDFTNAFQKALKGENGKEENEKAEFSDAENFFMQLTKERKERLQELKDAVRETARQVFISFDEAVGKVDTLEHSASRYHPEKVSDLQDEVNQDYSLIAERWKNTHHTLIDDWAVDVEVINLYYSVYDRHNHLKEEINGFISVKLEKSFDSIRSFIKASSKQISQSPATVRQVKEVIQAEREKVNKKLIDKILTQSIENLTHGFTDDFDELMAGTLELAGQVSDHRGYVRSASYDRGIRNSEINTISPRELLNIEALPAFQKNVTAIRETVESHLEKARLALMTLGTVCDFSLESAMMLVSQEKRGAKAAVETAVQGYERALFQLDNALSFITRIQSEVLVDLREAVNIFNEDIQKLKNTESIFELQMKIVHIKTVERSRRIKKQVAQYFLELVPNLVTFFKNTVTFSKDLVHTLKEKTGMSVDKKTVPFELMEFINQIQTALKKLPYVYQRLYQINPAEEERFFVNRNNEIELLNNSLENWKKGRFITCSVIGEKGSGTTSLINFFLLKKAQDLQVIQHTLAEKIYTSEKYFSLFGELLQKEGMDTNRQLIEYLNDSSEQQIIVLENLQHMFLKKVNGFNAIKLLFELFSHTSQKVFWIGVFTPVSYNYLDKTVFISNYFSDEIRLEGLRDETVREIIYKRNRLSGYQIQFVPGEEHLQSKSYHKLDDESKQHYLEGQFFTRLNRVSNGNISLAQLHWLSSTLKVDDKYIHIGAIQSPDVSFVKGLSGDKLFALQSIILHDGLILEDFAEVMKETEPYCRNLLIPMLEKGLLIRPREKFNINPVIYKPVYEYLLSRNFIH